MSLIDQQLPDALRAYIEQGHEVFEHDYGDWKINIRKPDSSKPLPEGAIIIAENGVGDVLFLKASEGREKKYQDIVHAYWHEGPQFEVFANSIDQLIHPKPTAHKTVFYFDGKTAVHVGDRVSVRGLFRRKTGTVTYVPGISQKDPEMEHHGMCWVGITFDDGRWAGTVVNWQTFRLKPKVSFVGRGSK